ncbi:MAG: AAA family ATPase [Bacillota bacterium]
MPVNERVRVVLAMSQATALRELKQVLEATGRVEVVAEAHDTNEAVDKSCASLPEVVVIEDGYDLDAFGVTETLMSLQPVPVVILSGRASVEEARKALAVSARDLLPRKTPVPVLVNAIAAARGQLARAPAQEQRGRVICVFSTKGGVGKSTIAANLAVGLARLSKRRVACVDLDLEFGCQATLMGVQPSSSIVDVTLLETGRLEEVLDKVMERTPYAGVRLLAAPPSPDLAAVVDGGGGGQSPGTVPAILESLRKNYNYIVVDLPCGFRDLNLTVLEASDLVLLVATPDIPTLQNTGKCLDVLVDRLDFVRESVRLVLNRSNAALGLPVNEIPKHLDFPVFYRLPSEGKTAVWSANTGLPFTARRGRTALTQAVMNLARQLIDEKVG